MAPAKVDEEKDEKKWKGKRKKWRTSERVYFAKIKFLPPWTPSIWTTAKGKNENRKKIKRTNRVSRSCSAAIIIKFDVLHFSLLMLFLSLSHSQADDNDCFFFLRALLGILKCSICTVIEIWFCFYKNKMIFVYRKSHKRSFEQQNDWID